jgi:hypothetical protein
MKNYVIKVCKERIFIGGDHIKLSDNHLMIIYKNEVVAVFAEWDYYYEELEEKNNSETEAKASNSSC